MISTTVFPSEEESLLTPTVSDQADYPADDTPILADTASLGFVWAAPAIAGWVGKNLASGIVGAIGGKLFGEALSAIGLGGPDVAGMLQDVTNRLIVIDRTMNEIKQGVQQILQQLESLRIHLDQSLLEVSVMAAFAKIDTAYGTADAALRGSVDAEKGQTAPSLMELLTSLPKSGLTPAELKPYADAFILSEGTQWDIPGQITLIHNVLVTGIGQSLPLINRWTDGIAAELQKKTINLEQAYKTLEGYFLQFISKQLQAVSIHCFALGSTASRRDYYLRKEFGPKMRLQTEEFLRCAERLAFLQTRLPKVPATSIADFPSEMDPILLRADLLCASLNLVSNERESATAKSAIAGIYGRALIRHSDLTVAGKGVEITPAGFAASRGVRGPEIQSLHAIELVRVGNELALNDHAASAPTVARYFWPWGSTLPRQGVPIDPRIRGGIRPEFYDVFNDGDWPLAAGFVDFSSVSVAAPVDAPSNLVVNSLFGNAGPDSVIRQEPFVPAESLHPLVRPLPNQIGVEFNHSAPANGDWHRQITFHLFKYSGKTPVKMRLTANAFCRVIHLMLTRQALQVERGANDLMARLSIVKQSPVQALLNSQTFYNSMTEGGGVVRLILKPHDYRGALDSWPTVDFEVSEGTYLLQVDLNAQIRRSAFFNGWKADGFVLQLGGVYVEWL